MTATRVVALLRGINVGRNKRIAMGDLRELVQGLGYPDAVTHLQSGNVILTSHGKRPQSVAREIEEAIARDLDMQVSVVARTGAQLAAVVEGNPWPQHTGEPKKLHVAFLSKAPAADRVRAATPDLIAPDEVVFAGADLYLWYPNGVLDTRIGNDFWKNLGVVSTTRNWNTVTRLLSLANG